MKLLGEFYEMLYHIYVVMKDIPNQIDTAANFGEILKETRGEMSTDYAQALYMKAKAYFQDENTPDTLALTTVRKSINIWRNTPLTGSPKDMNHAMALILKAHILVNGLKKYREAIKVYHKACIIVNEISGAKMNLENLINNIVGECDKVIKQHKE